MTTLLTLSVIAKLALVLVGIPCASALVLRRLEQV